MATRSQAEFELVVRAARLIDAGKEGAAVIGIRDGRIAAIGDSAARFRGEREVEFSSDVVVLPGLVDTHVHVCDPGTDWEGFESATKAAAAGGITTLVDMPIDSFPATLSPEALEAKRASARGRTSIDVGFWGGAVPQNLGQLKRLRESGVLGFKCFLIDPGVPDYSPMSSEQMEETLGIVRDLNVPLLVHAETPVGSAGLTPLNSRQYADYLASRPKEMENLAIAEVIDAARKTGGRAHVVHLSSADGVGMLQQARRDGIAVSVESCPHYLTLSAEQVPEGGTVFKCSPPIREEVNREALWKGLEGGLIDFVVSDHAPCTPEMKHQDSGNFGAAWGGISSLQLTLPIVWTEARRRGRSLADIAKWMAEGPAKFAGLRQKGRIAEGFDADFCVLAPDETFVVDPRKLYHRHPLTPYAGRTLNGVVRQTWLRGQPVELAKQPRGHLLESE